MFEDYMDHICNIYHLEETSVKAGYGIRPADIRAAEAEASEKAVPCHFHIKANNSVRIVQKEPYSFIDGDVKISFLSGTDIRKNDVVEDCRNGIKFRAGIPKEVHGGHHIIVTLSPLEGVSEAL